MERYSFSRRLAAEALGTALLVATVVGSGIMADRLTADDAVALLGNTLPTGASVLRVTSRIAAWPRRRQNAPIRVAFEKGIWDHYCLLIRRG